MGNDLQSQIGDTFLVLRKSDATHPRCLDLNDAEREALFFAHHRPGFQMEQLAQYLGAVLELDMSSSFALRFANNVWAELNLLTLCDYFGHRLSHKGRQVVAALIEGGW